MYLGWDQEIKRLHSNTKYQNAKPYKCKTNKTKNWYVRKWEKLGDKDLIIKQLKKKGKSYLFH